MSDFSTQKDRMISQLRADPSYTANGGFSGAF